MDCLLSGAKSEIHDAISRLGWVDVSRKCVTSARKTTVSIYVVFLYDYILYPEVFFCFCFFFLKPNQKLKTTVFCHYVWRTLWTMYIVSGFCRAFSDDSLSVCSIET